MRTITLEAPGKNALSSALMAWIVERLHEAGGEAVMLTGAGDAFSAGLNLREVASLDEAGMERFLDALERLVEAIYEYPGPTIAYVNGHAIAGGCIVALACDFRVGIADGAVRIGLNEVPIGLRFPPKTWRMVARQLPGHVLERVVLEGALHAPREALRLGLLDEVVENAEEARRFAERIAASPQEAYAAAKRAIRGGVLHVTQDERRRYLDEVLPSWSGPELKERLAARLKKG